MGSANPTPVDAFSSNNPFRRAASSRAGSPVKSPAMDAVSAQTQPTSLPPHQRTPMKNARGTSNSISSNPFADPLSPFSSPPATKADSARPSDEISKGLSGLSIRPVAVPPRDAPRIRPSSSPDKRDRAKDDVNSRTKDLGVSPEKQSKPSGRSKSRPAKTRNRGPALDFVDGLDTSWQLGIGASMHHGGPFDPCNTRPKRGKLNPIEAFAPNSGNMTMTGGAVNSKTAKDQQFDVLHMNTDEGYGDFNSTSKKADLAAVDATSRGEQIHSNNATPGLGTSTFLDGAPAPRREIERRESEAGQENINMGGGGLGGMTRRPSVLKAFTRARGYSQGRVGGLAEQDGGRGRRYPPPSLPQSAGGPARATPGQERQNPFFANSAMEIAIDDRVRTEGATGSSMGAPLTRRVTESGASPLRQPAPPQPDRPQGGGGPGFLGRWKSMRRNNNPPPQQATVPPGMI